jgi:hypothetical protein
MASFRKNPAFEKQAQAQPEFQAGVSRVTAGLAEEIKIAALPFRHTGYFIKKVRAGGKRVLLRDPFAHLSEYGSINNPPQANARRAARTAGMRFDDQRNPG